jgi:hypothetical protein
MADYPSGGGQVPDHRGDITVDRLNYPQRKHLTVRLISRRAIKLREFPGPAIQTVV